MPKKSTSQKVKLNHFTEDEVKELIILGNIAVMELGYNDKRVANAWHRAFEIFEQALNRRSENAALTPVKKEFESWTACRAADATDDFLDACLNTCQYERALELMETIRKMTVCPDDISVIEAELLFHSGQPEQAEQILAKNLEKNPNDPMCYVELGDRHYLWPIYSRRDHKQALKWYYQAYDLGLAKPDDRDGSILLERLADCTIDYLQSLTRDRLLGELERHDVGDWRDLSTIEQVLDRWRDKLNEPTVAARLLNGLMYSAKSEAERDVMLKIYYDYLNLCPRDNIGGVCPFLYGSLMTYGADSNRILNEKFVALEQALQKEFGNKEPFGAIMSDFMSHFQTKFMDEKDPVTGKKRQSVINQEHRRLQKLFDDGRLVWGDFARYRYQDPIVGFSMGKLPDHENYVIK